jgi:hypothetical protein
MENKTGVRQKNLLRTVKLAICESSRMQYRRIIWLKLARVSPEQEHYHPPPSGRSPSLAIVAARFFFQCPAVYQSIVINAAKSGGQEIFYFSLFPRTTAERGWTSGFLGYPPRPYAILFVIARSLVHDGRPVVMPKWRIFIIKIESAFRIGRECTESRTFRKIEGNYIH